MSQIIAHDDARLGWAGAVSVKRTADWSMPWRIPHEQVDLFAGTDPKVVKAAKSGSGVRLTFMSDTRSLAGKVLRATTEIDTVNPFAIDLCIDGEYLDSVVIDQDGAFGFEDLLGGKKLIELWLPVTDIFRLQWLELDEGADLAGYEDQRPRWVIHGSSIAHCSSAESPTQSWPAIVARGRGLHLTSMGFGGGCRMDPLVARIIRDLPADFITFFTGTNSVLGQSYNLETFRFLLAGFVKTIRDGHPETSLAVVSPVYCSRLDAATDVAGEYWLGIRQAAAEVVELLRTRGDSHLHFVDGLELLGHDNAALFSDGVHPDAEGTKLIGRNFLEKVIPRVFP